MHEKLEKAKNIVRRNWKPFTIGVVLTGVTFIVTKSVTTRYMRINGTSTFIHKAILKEGDFYNVFNIYSPGFKNQGPSWMVKCVETGRVYRSQEHAAKVMGLSKSSLSTHLSRNAGHVKGYHFERIGMAA